MKYVSVNKLSDFEFHDAKISLDTFDGNTLKVKASFLNIHESAEQNPNNTDMEIAEAFITFENFELVSYEPGLAFLSDANGEPYSIDPHISYIGNSARSRFMRQLEFGVTVYDFAIECEDVHFIDGIANDPFFTVRFTYKNIIIEWDEYKKEAWYAK